MLRTLNGKVSREATRRFNSLANRVSYCVVKERERERERERKRKRETERERKREKETEIEREREMGRERFCGCFIVLLLHRNIIMIYTLSLHAPGINQLCIVYCT